MRHYVPLVVLLSVELLSCVSGNVLVSVLDEGEKCVQVTDLWSCLKKSGAKVVGTVLDHQGEIPLLGKYLTLVPDNGQMENEGRANPSSNVTSPPSLSPSSSVFSKLLAFTERRMLRISLPMYIVTTIAGFSTSEGRGKKDKGSGAMMLGGMMMIATLLSTAFGALALMTAKGLMTSVLALMLSAMAVSKKSGGNGKARTTYEVINGPQGYHLGSDYKLENEAQVTDVNSQYNSAQTEPIHYGNQQYD